MARKKKMTKKELEKKEAKEVDGLEKKLTKEEQVKHENKILRNFLIGVAIVAFIIIAIYFTVQGLYTFTYQGVTYKVVKQGQLVFYETSFPVVYNGKKYTYDIYLRKDPRKLAQDVPFNGSVVLQNTVVLNSTSDFNCNGDGIIAIANFEKLSIFGTKFIKNESLGCSPQNKYTFINIVPGNVTEIEQTSPTCYTFYVNNCQILDVTERFMDSAFSQVNAILTNKTQ